MNIINAILGVPLGFVINLAYQLTGSYALAIIIFALIARTLVIPVNILAHKNSIRLLNLQPPLSVIKKRFASDRERLQEKQYDLFKKEKYSPYIGLVPLMIQLVLIIGIFQVMNNPARHIPSLDAGLLGFVPSFANPSVALLIPTFTGLSALLFCLVQASISPGALSQGRATNNGLTIFTVALMLYFALVMPLSVGLYLIFWNLFSIAAVFLLNALYNPGKLAGEALAYIESSRKTPKERQNERQEGGILRLREKGDVSRFKAAEKRLVFYALTGGQYKFYKNIIDYLLEHSDIDIHYLTNDPNDSVFAQESKRLIPYYASQKKTISLMLKLNADMLATTVPDLQSFHLKKSVVREDIEYLYIFHGPVSTHMMYREAAFDHFNTLFCVGSHHIAELRRREELASLPKRTLVKAGYGLYDQLVESYAAAADVKNDKPRVLIAPSWQEDNILELCIEEMLDSLIGNGFEIIVRPHPQFTGMFPERMQALREEYAQFSDGGEVVFELDFSGNRSIFASDVLITDWSGIAIEFSYCSLRPCVFINSPMKVMNPNYKEYGLDVLEVSIRDKFGVSVDVGDIGGLGEVVTRLLDEKDAYRDQIRDVLKENLYHPGRSGEAGGKYILNRIKQ